MSGLSRLRNMFRVPDLRNKILFTIFIIFIFRMGSHIPVPYVDFKQIEVLQESTKNVGGTLGLLDTFAGGAKSATAAVSDGQFCGDGRRIRRRSRHRSRRQNPGDTTGSPHCLPRSGEGWRPTVGRRIISRCSSVVDGPILIRFGGLNDERRHDSR